MCYYKKLGRLSYELGWLLYEPGRLLYELGGRALLSGLSATLKTVYRDININIPLKDLTVHYQIRNQSSFFKSLNS